MKETVMKKQNTYVYAVVLQFVQIMRKVIVLMAGVVT
jgi:hypothetical protein